MNNVELKTNVWGDGTIEQAVYAVDGNGRTLKIVQTLVRTGDQQIRDGLKQLGWLPPEEAAELQAALDEVNEEMRCINEREE